MIAYIESSALARAYLHAEPGHQEALALLGDPQLNLITGSWTRIEVSGALVRSTRRAGRIAEALLRALDSDLAPDTGTVTVIDAEQAALEGLSLTIVRSTGIRSMDAWHLACARLAFDELAEPGEELGFATRDAEQAAVAREMGFTIL